MKSTVLKYQTSLLFFTTFAAIFLRFVYYGFKYYPQIDDYIQYHNYATSIDKWRLVTEQGLLSARPLAGLADVFFWSELYSVMIVGVLFISLMFAASAVILYKLWNRYFGTGVMFIVLYSLLPLGFEGTYWMSASTRIVCGLFFSSLAGWLLDYFLRGGRLFIVPVWSLCQLVSFCFYEQTLVFSLALTIVIIMLNWRAMRREPEREGRKLRLLWGLLSLVNAAVYFIFTSSFARGVFASRMKLILPDNDYYFKVFLPDITGQVSDAFIKGGFYTFFKGFKRGAQIIFTDLTQSWSVYVYILCVASVSIIIYLQARRGDRATYNGRRALCAVLCGIFLTVMPIMPFFVISNPWFSLRATVSSLPGIALAADALLRFITKNRTAAAAAVLTAMCCVASVSELHDYRETYFYDQKAASAIYNELSRAGIDKKSRTGILSLNASYLDDQNFYYHEHIHGATHSGWALYGAVSATAYDAGDNTVRGDIVPLATDGENFYAAWNRETKNLGGFDVLYYWDDKIGRLLPLRAERSDNGEYTLYFADGTICARTREENGIGYITLKSDS